MIINENILKRYISYTNLDLNFLKSLINNHMIEVENEYILNKNNKKLLIGEILSFKKIPNSQKLNLVQVNIGSSILSIICGADNIKIKKKVIVALEGAYLGQNSLKVNKKTILGIESQGVICSAKEINLKNEILSDEEKKGILILDEKDSKAIIGNCALNYLSMKGFFLKLSITPDRGDLLSYLGFAKDLKAILINNNYNHANLVIPKLNNLDIINKKNPFKIELKNKNCQEFHYIYLTNVKVQESPLWLRSFLAFHDITPVNNIIDVINLVLIETGVPLDVIDVSNISDYNLKIRNSYDNEKIIISGGKEYFLKNEDLILKNKNKIISLIGLINNEENNLNEKTDKILIMSSYFKYQNIFKTSKRLNIKNEKIINWSRGFDPLLIKNSLNQAVFILKKLNKEIIINDNIISIFREKILKKRILINLDFIQKKTGIILDLKKIINFLKNLDYKIKILDEYNLEVIPPLRRHDIETQEDIIADLVRMNGYDTIENKKIIKKNLISDEQKKINKLKSLLINLGFHEIITYSLVNSQNCSLFLIGKESNYLSLKKPLSQERSILRQNLSGNMLEVLSYNQKYNNFDNSFFEIGNIYKKENNKKTEEILHLSLGINGIFINSGWIKENINSSIFILKGVLKKIEKFLNINFLLYKSKSYCNLHPGNQIDIFFENEKVGFIGEIHPSLKKFYNLKNAFILELTLKKEFFQKKQKQINFKEITKLPSIVRDLSILVEKKYNYETILKTLSEEITDILINCELIDVYQDKKFSSKEYSLSFRLIFNDQSKNLQKNIVKEIMNKIENKIKTKYKATIR
ncbi:phenylalanine--tRNA ligase subunit beta [Texas Phoenix palm phytoplasma]|uniref:Phenylalanine--tRNA ligase beta subunit n=1 Tax=Texas Phoenix palm phytoplasma TaxID=176709 RepID=A0ABS5BIU2_9MOLU|nr:phenylalanine--tRNA ligase subunit beta [Texas Phoenix palm phytoplasma]MBP3059507.1 phenylalanine--tRNA ligase subunit beta [Texas Phoenix palm phytoplasma]